MLIEEAVFRGAKCVRIQCKDVKESWKSFRKQFDFVQAAGGLVINDQGEILFIYRHEKWDLPKGKVEKNESIDAGAIREVEEECSVTGLLIQQELVTTWHTYIQEGVPMLKATAWYLMTYPGNEVPQPQLIEGITEVRWLKPDQLSIVRANTYPSVLDVVNDYLKQLS
jgi:ADP-ribose pyrophosphatase YjhB (NUDIX family)